MMSRFVTADRDTPYLFPLSVTDWLPEDDLARFVVEVVDQLDLSELTRPPIRGTGIEGAPSGGPAQLVDLRLCHRGVLQQKD